MSGTVDLAAAEAAYAQGAFAKAAALLAPLVGPEQSEPLVFRLLGLAQLRLGAADAAVASIEAALRHGADDAALALDYGIALQSVGRVAEAAAQYRRAAEGLPREAAPLLNGAAAQIALGDAAAAVRLARKGVLRAERLPQAHYVLGQALMAAGRGADALAAFRRCTELDARFADAWINLGVAEYRLGRMDAAQAAMRAALRVDPRNVRAAGNLAVFLRLTGDTAEAERILHQVARVPQAADARLVLASWRRRTRAIRRWRRPGGCSRVWR